MWSATYNENVEAVKLFLERGADRHRKNNAGVSSVDVAKSSLQNDGDQITIDDFTDFSCMLQVFRVFVDADIADLMFPFVRQNFAMLPDDVKKQLPSEFKRKYNSDFKLLKLAFRESMHKAADAAAAATAESTRPESMHKDVGDSIIAHTLEWRHVFSSVNGLTGPLLGYEDFVQHVRTGITEGRRSSLLKDQEILTHITVDVSGDSVEAGAGAHHAWVRMLSRPCHSSRTNFKRKRGD